MASKRKRSERDDVAPAKREHKQRFREQYAEEWPTLQISHNSEFFAFCSLCCKEFSVKNGGKDDCRRHVSSKRHLDLEKEKKSMKSIAGFFEKSPTIADKKANECIRAEVMLVDLVTSMNLPLTACSTFSSAFNTMFKDSETAKNFKCGRSKATAIVKELAAQTTLKLAYLMQKQPFTLSTDGSNDAGSCKLFPIVVRIVHPEKLEVRSEILSVPVCEGSATGENIFNLISAELNAHNIPWDNCLALGCDNAAVMIGKVKGVYGCLLKCQPSAYLSGCVCHLIHIAAEKGAACLPLSVDELLIDVYYYLDKSSKRQAAFKDLQLLYDIKENKILKHVGTRWLSISRCLPRILENWEPLLAFFKEEENNSKTHLQRERASKLRTIFSSPTNRLICLFLVDALLPFDHINTELQCDAPKIQVLKHSLEYLLKTLLLKFVQPKAMIYKNAIDVDLDNADNIKANEDLLIGQRASDFIARKREVHLRDKRLDEFYEGVKQFFITATKYIKMKLPLKDDLLNHAEILDPKKQLDVKFSSLEYFIKRFPKLLPTNVSVSDVQQEFALYQCTDIQSCLQERVDETWAAISRLKDNGQLLFNVLPNVMLSIMTIPHSSAHCERIFSLVRKNQTEFRSRLSNDTMEALLVNKCRPEEVTSRVYSDQELSNLKSAYYRQLQSNQ